MEGIPLDDYWGKEVERLPCIGSHRFYLSQKRERGRGMKRQIVVWVLAILMVFGGTVGLAEAQDWRTPYAEPVDVHIALMEPSNPIFQPGQDYTKNLWWDLFKERFNVNVIVDWSAKSDQYNTKLNLAIASGELPEMFRCNVVQLNQLMDAGMLEDLTDAYNNGASPSIKKMMESNWDIVETAMRDGKMYAMPILHYGFECETSFVWARKDWVDKAGVTGFETLDDVQKLMDTFMAEDGAKYGIVLEKTLDAMFRSASMFNALPRIWYPSEDGTLIYGSVQPAMKDVLAKWAEWYQAGYIRSDFGALDGTQSFEDAYTGNTGIAFSGNWAGWSYGQDMIKNQGEGTYFVPFDYPKAANGEYVKYPVPFNNTGYSVVLKGSKNADVLVKLISAYCDVLNDSLAEGTMTIEEVLPFNTDEMHHITGPFKVEFASYQDTLDVAHAMATGEEKFNSGYGYIYYQEAKKWADSQDPVGLGRYLQMAMPEASLVVGTKHVDRDQIQKDAVWGLRPQVLLDYGSTLDDILLEGFTQIILGNESLDYFDAVVENWKMAGGDEVSVAVNEMYGNK